MHEADDTEAEVMRMFHVFDKDGDEFIDTAELKFVSHLLLMPNRTQYPPRTQYGERR